MQNSDYQSTEDYLDDNGVTKLLAYEGPIGYTESRKEVNKSIAGVSQSRDTPAKAR